MIRIRELLGLSIPPGNVLSYTNVPPGGTLFTITESRGVIVVSFPTITVSYSVTLPTVSNVLKNTSSFWHGKS